MSTLAEYVKDVLLGYEGIADADEVAIDFLGMTPTRFSVRGEPVEQVLKWYLNGDSLRHYVCGLEGICDTISDSDRAANNRLFEGLGRWLEIQTRRRLLPEMGNGAQAISIKPLDHVYLAREAEDGDAAMYLMQIGLTYYQKVSEE